MEWMLGVYSNPISQPRRSVKVATILPQMFGEIIPTLREQMLQMGSE